MKRTSILGAAFVALVLSVSALAQQATQRQPDQVDQLAEMVGLTEDQQSEIRAILDDMQGKIGELRQEARQIQLQMQAEIKADYLRGRDSRERRKTGGSHR